MQIIWLKGWPVSGHGRARVGVFVLYISGYYISVS